jgi:hypothetical protein
MMEGRRAITLSTGKLHRLCAGADALGVKEVCKLSSRAALVALHDSTDSALVEYMLCR